jgi:hypothetical protein
MKKKTAAQHKSQTMQALDAGVTIGGAAYGAIADTSKAIRTKRRDETQPTPRRKADRKKKP